MNAAAGEPPDERRRLAWLVTAAFVLLTLPRLLLHELWRDEAWLWLAVNEARSPAELFTALARTGQGTLFPLLCYVARYLSPSPVAMQVLHLALASAAAFVFVRWSPWPRHVRLLFVLGYFPFYEYAVISRHYAAGALLVWLACAAVRARRPLALGIALGLLCQTTVYGWILAVAIACGWWLERRGQDRPRANAASVTGLGLALTGAAAGLIEMIPAPGTSFAPGWQWRWLPQRAFEVMATPWRSFMPLPRLRLTFWNTNLLDPWPALQAAAGLGILALVVALLWRHRVALAIFAVGAAGLLAFGYLKLIGEMRHAGHLWLLLAAALWIGARPGDGVGGGGRSWRDPVLTSLLLVHVAAAAFASGVDMRHPFSNGAAIAGVIRAEGLDRHPLLGHREPPAATVALALRRPLYSPSRHLFTTRPDWGPEQREISDHELRCEARALALRLDADVVLVINRALPAWEELDAAGSRVGAIVPSEDYHLYLLRRARLSASAGAAGCSP